MRCIAFLAVILVLPFSGALPTPATCAAAAAESCRDPTWEVVYNDPQNYGDVLHGVLLGGGRAILVADGPPGGQDTLLVAYDPPSGARLWESTYSHEPRGYDVPEAWALSPDGAMIFVQISSYDAMLGHGVVALVAWNATDGARLWERRIDANPGAVAAAEGITYAVSGGVVRAYAAADGALRWSAALPGPVRSIVPVADGARIAMDGALLPLTPAGLGVPVTLAPLGLPHAFVTHSSFAQGGARFLVAGNIVFPDKYRHPFGDLNTLTGGWGERDAFVAAYDSGTGALLWATRLGTAGAADALDGMIPAGPGALVLWNGEILTRIGGDGGTLWSVAPAMPGPAMDITGFSFAGNLAVVTGAPTEANGQGTAMIAYDLITGAEAWQSFHAPPVGSSETDPIVFGDAERVLVAEQRSFLVVSGLGFAGVPDNDLVLRDYDV